MDDKDMGGAKSGTRPFRLGAFVDGVGWVEHEYGRVYDRSADHVTAAPDYGQIDLVASLAGELAPPFRILYVLHVPRDHGPDEGKYELAGPMDHDELRGFLHRYRELFESDGRHDLIVESHEGRISYDQHNVLELDGPVVAYERVLREAGLVQGEVRFPSPHSHHYHEELDPLHDDLFERYQWVRVTA